MEMSKLKLLAYFDCIDWDVFEASTLYKLSHPTVFFVCRKRPVAKITTINSGSLYIQRQLHHIKKEVYSNEDQALYKEGKLKEATASS